MLPRMKRTLFALAGFLGLGMAAAVAQAPKRALGLDDLLAWKNITGTALSHNGQWFAYREDGAVGNGSAVFRQTQGAKAYRFNLGEPPPPAGRGMPGRGALGGAADIGFSSDGRFGAFLAYPTHAERAALRKQRKPAAMHAGVVSLATGAVTTVARARRFAFSGSNPDWIAIQMLPPAGLAGSGRGAPSAQPGALGRRGAAAGGPPKYTPGTDLILRNLHSGEVLDIGNVGDFAFDRQGHFLAWTVSSPDKSGNGVEYRDLASGAVRTLDSQPGAVYTKLAWNEKGTALAVLRGTDIKGFQDRRYDVLGFTHFGPAGATKTVFVPSEAASFPKGFAVSPDRTPQWTENLDALLFGIHRLRPVTAGSAAGARGGRGGRGPAPTSAADAVDLEIWNYQDPRLQSEQIVDEGRDRNFSYLCEYRPAERQFLRLADKRVKNVTAAPHDRYAIGLSIAPYELESHLNGQTYADIYVIDLATGKRSLALRKARWGEHPAPDGVHFAYYRDGNWYVYDMATGASRNLTATAPVTFVNVEDDHNLKKPPAPFVGWSRDSRDLLLSDLWDIWKVPINGGPAVNWTGDGKRDGIRYRNPVNFAAEYDPAALGFDLTQPLYLNAYGEWTKKDGIAVVQPGRPGAHRIMFEEASYGGLSKAKDAPVYLYTRQTYKQPPDVYATGAGFAPGTKLTDLAAQVKPFRWTSGTILVNYLGYGGVRLQGALHLPPDYVKGREYPTIVEFYEKMSQNAYTFIRPAVVSDGFNIAEYLSNGYAVFDPDIHYKVDDPGISSSICLENAVKAAIATGVPDPKHIGIHGHSWGGYQTAFVITQTHLFAAAVAGAPLTDMISMYGIIYKNAGITNGQIFEASQGRFSGPPWKLWAAYTRNSPIYGVENVTTPLLMVSDFDDGAVDFTQGMEFFNDLRRAHKRVVLLDYPSQNHLLAKRADQKDYTVRMKQFFDHFLKGAPLPSWYAKGVPALDMKTYLKEFLGKYEK
jgi:fermentation-respiration switch protein FrsA (DUF1100 family)